MSWKKFNDFVGKKNVVLELGENATGFATKIVLFEHITKPSYSEYYTFKAFGESYTRSIKDNIDVRVPDKKVVKDLIEQWEKQALDKLRFNLHHDFDIGSEVETFMNGKHKILKPEYQRCLESHFYRLQETVKDKGRVSVKNKDDKFGKSTLKFGDSKQNKHKAEAIKALDGILAVAYVALLGDFKKHELLSKVATYGKGIHYARLNNAWAMHPLVGNLVIDIGRKVVVFGQKGLYKFWDIKPAELKAILEKSDVKKARTVLKRNEKIFKGIISAAYQDEGEVYIDNIFTVFMKGIKNNLASPFAFKTNWLINKGKVDDDGDSMPHGEIKDYQVGENANMLGKDSKF
jgi:hypothetical protein